MCLEFLLMRKLPVRVYNSLVEIYTVHCGSCSSYWASPLWLLYWEETLLGLCKRCTGLLGLCTDRLWTTYSALNERLLKIAWDIIRSTAKNSLSGILKSTCLGGANKRPKTCYRIYPCLRSCFYFHFWSRKKSLSWEMGEGQAAFYIGCNPKLS